MQDEIYQSPKWFFTPCYFEAVFFLPKSQLDSQVEVPCQLADKNLSMFFTLLVKLK